MFCASSPQNSGVTGGTKWSWLARATETPYTWLPCSNVTYSYLHINYTHSTEQVIIVPEFPAFVILPLFMLSALAAIVLSKKKYVSIRK